MTRPLTVRKEGKVGVCCSIFFNLADLFYTLDDLVVVLFSVGCEPWILLCFYYGLLYLVDAIPCDFNDHVPGFRGNNHITSHAVGRQRWINKNAWSALPQQGCFEIGRMTYFLEETEELIVSLDIEYYKQYSTEIAAEYRGEQRADRYDIPEYATLKVQGSSMTQVRIKGEHNLQLNIDANDYSNELHNQGREKEKHGQNRVGRIKNERKTSARKRKREKEKKTTTKRL